MVKIHKVLWKYLNQTEVGILLKRVWPVVSVYYIIIVVFISSPKAKLVCLRRCCFTGQHPVALSITYYVLLGAIWVDLALKDVGKSLDGSSATILPLFRPPSSQCPVWLGFLSATTRLDWSVTAHSVKHVPCMARVPMTTWCSASPEGDDRLDVWPAGDKILASVPSCMRLSIRFFSRWSLMCWQCFCIWVPY